jgi:large subunit ribosomal protein L36e
MLSQRLKFLLETLTRIVIILLTLARKRVQLIRRVVAEITGRSNYERKIIELLKQSKANANKKAYKLAKRSLGTHKRALKKKNELTELISRK